MKKIFCILLAFSVSVSAFALEIGGEPPTYKAKTPGNPTQEGLADLVNTELASAFNSAKDDLNDTIGGMVNKPEKFIQAWGNSGIFASHGATQRAFGGYKIFTVTIGSMMGFQLPVSPFKIIDELENVTQRLNKEGDIALGFNPQMFNAHIGFNMSFLVKNLYLGLRFGYLKLPNFIEGLSYDNGSVGFLVNYQLLPQINLFGVLAWRGINLGTGFIYQGTVLDYKIALSPISQSTGQVTGLNSSLNLTIKPELVLNMDIKTYTIPIEAMTALKILFLNIPFGLGFDIGFGKSDLKVGMNGDVIVDGLNSNFLEKDDDGKLSISAGGDMAPTALNIKLMTGLGFAAGPVIVDIPFTYYFRGNGFSIGFTAGVTF